MSAFAVDRRDFLRTGAMHRAAEIKRAGGAR